MAIRRRYPNLDEKTDDFIDRTFTNILTNGDIFNLKRLRDAIFKIIDDIPSVDESPSWFQEALNKIVSTFNSLFPEKSDPASVINVTEIYNGLMYDDVEARNIGINYTIPFLQTYAATQKLLVAVENNLISDPNIKSLVESTIKERLDPIDSMMIRLNDIEISASESLALINKEAGKIGVKRYATIFEDQARKHSMFIHKEVEDNITKWAWGFGSAQLWIACTVVFIAGFGFLIYNLDTIFPIVGEKFNPNTLVHLAGRIVSLSLCIFLISFALKQYRINMHLYTLNQYRSNTLKSFEYFTRAPDSLDPTSYNAILMKVAESIYEAGQTGYISSTETNNDMPSIVDMTKIITPGGK